MEAAHLARGEDHVAGLLRVEELVDGGLAREVELGARAADDVGEAQRGQAMVDGGAEHTFVAGEERRLAIVVSFWHLQLQSTV